MVCIRKAEFLNSVFPQQLSTELLEEGSFTGTELTNSSGMIGQQAAGIVYFLQYCSYKYMPPHSVWSVVVVVWVLVWFGFIFNVCFRLEARDHMHVQ